MRVVKAAAPVHILVLANTYRNVESRINLEKIKISRLF
jgi:hypothetical protein